MSGFNTNSIVSINSEKLAKIYKNEFNQMYEGKFHSEKKTHFDNKNTRLCCFVHLFFCVCVRMKTTLLRVKRVLRLSTCCQLRCLLVDIKLGCFTANKMVHDNVYFNVLCLFNI